MVSSRIFQLISLLMFYVYFQNVRSMSLRKMGSNKISLGFSASNKLLNPFNRDGFARNMLLFPQFLKKDRSQVAVVKPPEWKPIPYGQMTLGIPKEIAWNERRVAQSPVSVMHLVSNGWTVQIEKGAGLAAGFPDSSYEEAGAVIVDRNKVWKSDVVAKIQPPDEVETGFLENRILISFIQPEFNYDLIEQLQSQGATAFAMDCVPKSIPRAQEYSALTSQANIAGYRAVVEAAHEFGRTFSGKSTPTRDYPPANVLVLGAGVAGLSAISAAKGMGATVKAYDTRSEARTRVEEAGGQFLDLGEQFKGLDPTSPSYRAAEVQAMKKWTAEADIIITTALMIGRTSPTYVSADMVSKMNPGSVIVDMAASYYGGNCAVSEVDTVITTHNDVKVIGYSDMPSRAPATSSNLFGNNVAKFLLSVGPATNPRLQDTFFVDLNDEVVKEMLVVDRGNNRYTRKDLFKQTLVNGFKSSPETPVAESVIVDGLDSLKIPVTGFLPTTSEEDDPETETVSTVVRESPEGESAGDVKDLNENIWSNRFSPADEDTPEDNKLTSLEDIDVADTEEGGGHSDSLNAKLFEESPFIIAADSRLTLSEDNEIIEEKASLASEQGVTPVVVPGVDQAATLVEAALPELTDDSDVDDHLDNSFTFDSVSLEDLLPSTSATEELVVLSSPTNVDTTLTSAIAVEEFSTDIENNLTLTTASPVLSYLSTPDAAESEDVWEPEDHLDVGFATEKDELEIETEAETFDRTETYSNFDTSTPSRESLDLLSSAATVAPGISDDSSELQTEKATRVAALSLETEDEKASVVSPIGDVVDEQSDTTTTIESEATALSSIVPAVALSVPEPATEPDSVESSTPNPPVTETATVDHEASPVTTNVRTRFTDLLTFAGKKFYGFPNPLKKPAVPEAKQLPTVAVAMPEEYPILTSAVSEPSPATAAATATDVDQSQPEAVVAGVESASLEKDLLSSIATVAPGISDDSSEVEAQESSTTQALGLSLDTEDKKASVVLPIGDVVDELSDTTTTTIESEATTLSSIVPAVALSVPEPATEPDSVESSTPNPPVAETAAPDHETLPVATNVRTRFTDLLTFAGKKFYGFPNPLKKPAVPEAKQLPTVAVSLPEEYPILTSAVSEPSPATAATVATVTIADVVQNRPEAALEKVFRPSKVKMVPLEERLNALLERSKRERPQRIRKLDSSNLSPKVLAPQTETILATTESQSVEEGLVTITKDLDVRDSSISGSMASFTESSASGLEVEEPTKQEALAAPIPVLTSDVPVAASVLPIDPILTTLRMGVVSRPYREMTEDEAVVSQETESVPIINQSELVVPEVSAKQFEETRVVETYDVNATSFPEGGLPLTSVAIVAASFLMLAKILEPPEPFTVIAFAILLLTHFRAQGLRETFQNSPELAPVVSLYNTAIGGAGIIGGLSLLNTQVLVPQTEGQLLGAIAVFLSMVNFGSGVSASNYALDSLKKPNYETESCRLFISPAVGLAIVSGLAATAPLGSQHLVADVGSSSLLTTSSTPISVKGGKRGLNLAIASGVAALTGVSLQNLHSGYLTKEGVMQTLIIAGAGLSLGTDMGFNLQSNFSANLPQFSAMSTALTGASVAAFAIGKYFQQGIVMDEGSLTLLYSTSLVSTAVTAAGLGSVSRLSEKIKGVDGRGWRASVAPFLSTALIGFAAAVGITFVDNAVAERLVDSYWSLAIGSLAASLLGIQLAVSTSASEVGGMLTTVGAISGWTLCAEGAIQNNDFLVAAGALVGFSNAVTRDRQPPNNWILSMFRGAPSAKYRLPYVAAGHPDQVISVEKSVTLLKNARRVEVVVGQGLSNCGQSAAAELAVVINELKNRGIEVEVFIPYDAGLIPGQLDWLLKVAGVDYSRRSEQGDLALKNSQSDETVTLVVGAYDSVRQTSGRVVAMLRSHESTGFSGLVNPLLKSANKLEGDIGSNLNIISALIREE